MAHGNRFTNLAGREYGRLTVVSLAGQRPRSGESLWACRCVCGTEKVVSTGKLQSGNTRSCGCLHDEMASARWRTHGQKKHHLYETWSGMRKRCNNAASAIYRHYGGRGIEVCDRWNDFALFLADMEPTWAPGLSLDRIDVNGNYEPSNVRWATKTEQANNRRDNIVMVTPEGQKTICLAAREAGLSFHTVYARRERGWPDDKLLLPLGSKVAA